ncbi:MAG: hypothetical protein NT018_05000 [Armatimonadetes bacterium]|nr:hypothetical protein [Armatimonadota bacterium]
MNIKRRLIAIVLMGVVLISAVLALPRIGAFRRLMLMLQGKKTVEDRLRQYGPDARLRLDGFFKF